MRALVTGASGFVGRALVEHLTRAGHRVRALVRRREIDVPDVEVVRGDLTALASPESLLETIDVVFHLAGLTDERHAAEDLRRQNVDATANLATEARRFGVGRFVYLSTVKVHGDDSGSRPFRESDPIEPRGSYARSKAEAEDVVRELLASGPTRWSIVRSPLVYGPGAGANFEALVRFVERGLPLPLGRAVKPRSMVYIGNLTDALEFVARSSGAENDSLFVSDAHDISPAELVRLTARASGRSARLVPVPRFILRGCLILLGRRGWGERLTRPLMIDLGKLRRLGWQAPFAPEDAIRATMAERDRSRRAER